MKLRVPRNGGNHILGQRRTKVALGYPFGAGVTGYFLESFARLVEYELSKPEPLLSHRIPQSGLYIDHNRNNIVQRFMETDAEWLLQVDSDIQFPPTLIESLLAVATKEPGKEHKIVGASVPLGPPLPSCGWMMTDQPGIWAAIPSHQITEAGVPCHGLATAVILVHREVCQAIADQVGQCWFLKMMVPRLTKAKSVEAWREEGNRADREYVSVGEDLAFCMRALDAGYTSWVCKVPGLRHHKTLPLSHDFEDAAAAASAEVLVGADGQPVPAPAPVQQPGPSMPLDVGPLPYESVVEV